MRVFLFFLGNTKNSVGKVQGTREYYKEMLEPKVSSLYASPTRQQSGLESAKGRAQVHRAGKVCPRIGVLGGLSKTEGRRRMTTEIGN